MTNLIFSVTVYIQSILIPTYGILPLCHFHHHSYPLALGLGNKTTIVRFRKELHGWA